MLTSVSQTLRGIV